jgi:hypothetical protein
LQVQALNVEQRRTCEAPDLSEPNTYVVRSGVIHAIVGVAFSPLSTFEPDIDSVVRRPEKVLV